MDTLAPSGATTLAEGDAAPVSVVEPGPGTTIGRYVVLSRIGSGGMGVVLSAYDPELDRRIAIKLVHQRRATSPVDRLRLHNEAQALARLSHPNVVAVHDVGEHGRQVFVAMEFVQGPTLAQWLADSEHPRPWRQVLAVMLAAGEGLAAAHDRGLIHRDFKPDNIMLGDDGRVRVMDFGLVRSGDVPESAGEGQGHSQSQSQIQRPDDRIARTETDSATGLTGGLLGTPAYMAPEQLSQGKLCARTDQFAFFMVLYEALYGHRPFAGDTVGTIAFNVLRGNVIEPRSRNGSPGWLHRIILRGLALHPEERFADMREALTAIGSGHARRRRNGALLATAAALSLVGAFVGYQRWDRADREATCRRAGAVIEDTWNEDARTDVEAAILATPVGYAQTTATNVMPWIDLRAQQWRTARIVACENATVHETWSSNVHDKAAWCLEEKRVSMAALVGALADADAQVVQTAVQSAARLRSPQVCVEEAVLAGLPPPPDPDLRATVNEVRTQISRASALREAGHISEGLELVRHARQSADTIGWEPVIASALVVESALLLSAGHYAKSESAGTQAYLRAFRSRSWGTAADAATTLAFTVGYSERRPDDGMLWAELAAAAIHHSGDPTKLREASRLASIGAIRSAQGEYEQAIEAIAGVLELVEEVLGDEHPNTALVLSNLGATHQSFGASTRARQFATRAVAIWEATLGPEHPNTAAGLHTLGRASAALGDDREAASLFERALAIREATLGPDHPSVADSLVQLAESRRRSGAGAELRPSYERALEIVAQSRGERSMAVLDGLVILGELELEWGRPLVARAYLERALPLHERHESPAAAAAKTRFLLAKALWAAPRTTAEQEQAIAEAQRARTMLASSGDDDAVLPLDAWLQAHR